MNSIKYIIDYLKSQSSTKMFQILIVIQNSFTRNSKLLHQLYIRGRHQYISTITSTQVYKAISTIIRKNMTHLFVYRLRNASDLEAWNEELSGVYDKKHYINYTHLQQTRPIVFIHKYDGTR